VISDECTTHKQWHVKCSSKLAKIAQIMQNKCTPGNDAIAAMMTLTSRKRLLLGYWAWFLSVQKYCQLFMHELNTFLFKKYTIQTNGNEKPGKPPNPLGHVDPHPIHECLSRPHSPIQTTVRSIHKLSHNYTTKSPLVTMECPIFTLKIGPSPSPIAIPL